MSKYTVVWDGGPCSLAIPADASMDSYPSAFLEELAQIISAHSGTGEFRVEYDTSDYAGEIRCGIERGPVFVDDHFVRIFFHDVQAQARPTYELEPPDEVPLRSFVAFLEQVNKERNDDGSLSLPAVSMGPPTLSKDAEDDYSFSSEDVSAYLNLLRSEADSESGAVPYEDALMLLIFTFEDNGVAEPSESRVAEVLETLVAEERLVVTTADGSRMVQLPDSNLLASELASLREVESELSATALALDRGSERLAEIQMKRAEAELKLESLLSEERELAESLEKHRAALADEDLDAIQAKIAALEKRLA